VLKDSSIRRSLDEYIKMRIREIPSDINETFLKIKQIWKCENEVDFLYGYYIGKLQEGALHYLLKATRASSDNIDSFEIRGIIEEHRKQIRQIISDTLSK